MVEARWIWRFKGVRSMTRLQGAKINRWNHPAIIEHNRRASRCIRFWCKWRVAKSHTIAFLVFFSIQDCINFYVPLDVIVSLTSKGQKMGSLESALRADFWGILLPNWLRQFGNKFSSNYNWGERSDPARALRGARAGRVGPGAAFEKAAPIVGQFFGQLCQFWHMGVKIDKKG